MIVVGRLKVALEPQLWELGKVLRKAGYVTLNVRVWAVSRMDRKKRREKWEDGRKVLKKK